MKVATVAEHIAFSVRREYAAGTVRSGLSCIPKSLGSDFMTLEDFIQVAQDYDVVHFFPTLLEQGMIQYIKSLLSPSQKMFINMDAANVSAHLFLSAQEPNILRQGLSQTDLINVVTPEQNQLLGEFMEDETYKSWLHQFPADVESARSLKTADGSSIVGSTRVKAIGIIGNHYAPMPFPAAMAACNVRKYNPGFIKRINHYNTDPFLHANRDRMKHYVDDFMQPLPYPDWLTMLSGTAILAETNCYETASRVFQDACILGVPIVVSKYSWYPKLTGYAEKFPELTVNPFVASEYKRAFETLTDQSLYEECSKWLYKAASEFTLEKYKDAFSSVIGVT